MRSWLLRVWVPFGPWGQQRLAHEGVYPLDSAIAMSVYFKRKYGKQTVCTVRTVPVESSYAGSLALNLVKELVK